jgi:hypothetical protein
MKSDLARTVLLNTIRSNGKVKPPSAQKAREVIID